MTPDNCQKKWKKLKSEKRNKEHLTKQVESEDNNEEENTECAAIEYIIPTLENAAAEWS